MVVKAIKYIIGIYYFWIFSRKISLKAIVKNKRVVVIGAADTAIKCNQKDEINSFDVVVRLNKAPHRIKEVDSFDSTGTKIDILFHNFFENEKFGGGKLDLKLYKDLGIKFLINPISNSFGKRNTFNFYKKYLKAWPVYNLSKSQYRNFIKNFDNFRPTVGFLALCYLMECDFKELYITGFTFFKTDYSKGYRNELTKSDEIRNVMSEMKIHNPDLEFEEFLKIFNKNKGKNILVDEGLLGIIQDYNQSKIK